jgi:hypothetical protein
MQKLIPALLLFALALVSCGKSDDDVVAKSPTWVVTLYQIPSNNIAVKEDKTAQFNGYAFEFNDDDKMVIHQPSGATIDAKWAVDDVTSTAAFGADNPGTPVSDILGDWKVTEQTDTNLKLEGQNDQSASANFGKVLHFVKQ